MIDPTRHKPYPKGCLLLVSYLDHVLFKDTDASLCRPWTREAIGWLDHEDMNHIRIIWERSAMPGPPNGSKEWASGLVILKATIVDMRRIT